MMFSSLLPTTTSIATNSIQTSLPAGNNNNPASSYINIVRSSGSSLLVVGTASSSSERPPSHRNGLQVVGIAS
ncbi:hypothetical protein PGT21_031363 [Puccinia graminis f. sp. tritici]|uniref:Uncharacterized protein n=1 Tax=Puccinia graminis f. sp. tritici TaxID=56615 RepID=A0A5B0PHW7_PUCGR|nr:hypothetical protein PGT21_031363 [Puccinia graminis f. sp. tritici]KAA1120639.1 hypothetical protein PGTUg99_015618 [Puccinia graminis f. sp. tritici]